MNQASKPFAERSDRILRNLDMSLEQFARGMTSFGESLATGGGQGSVQRFFSDASLRLDALQQALMHGDAAAAEQAAHALKGSAANLGAQRIADSSEEIEKLSRAGDLVSIVPIVAHLQGEIAHAQAIVNAELARV